MNKLDEYFETNIIAQNWLNDYHTLRDLLVDIQYHYNPQKISSFGYDCEEFLEFSYNILKYDFFYDVFIYYVEDVASIFEQILETPITVDGAGMTNAEFFDIMLEQLDKVYEERKKEAL